MKIVLVGIQGAGKSTQGNLLAENLGIKYLSSGHILREMAKEKTPLGRWVKETINAGVLIPDGKMIEIMTDYLQRPEYEPGFILDGFPRTVPQAETFDNNVDTAVFIDVSDREALWRISGRVEDREDETLKAIRKRIELFHTHTQPVIDYYQAAGKLVRVDGEQEIQAIFNEIMEKLKS